MNELLNKNKLCKRHWNILKKKKIGTENNNYHKALKIAEPFNNIERIRSDKESTDTETI